MPQIEMVLIPAGTFMMGSPDGVGQSDEYPQHPVTVQSFYIGKYEVTQAQYRAVMGANPSEFKVDDLPVEHISWNDAAQFCRRLSQLTGRAYRLPTEAEWEYACRAGTTGDYSSSLDIAAWFRDNSGNARLKEEETFGTNNNRPHPVGQKQPNGFGLYDMHGNVDEWCEDYHHGNYLGAPTNGSAWLSGDSRYRVARGGSYFSFAMFLRSAYRGRSDRYYRVFGRGLRVAADSRSS